MRSRADRMIPTDGGDPHSSAEIIPFPSVKMIGRHRITAAQIAALPPEERAKRFQDEVLDWRDKMRTIGVNARAAHSQARALALALATELVRNGHHGGWDGWLRNSGRKP